jgi:hypothetical protein
MWSSVRYQATPFLQISERDPNPNKHYLFNGVLRLEQCVSLHGLVFFTQHGLCASLAREAPEGLSLMKGRWLIVSMVWLAWFLRHLAKHWQINCHESPQSKLPLLDSQLSLHLLLSSQFLQFLLRVHVLELLERHGAGISLRGCRWFGSCSSSF